MVSSKLSMVVLKFSYEMRVVEMYFIGVYVV